ncbi:tripartite tricarboxylate transporter TctB family protein [Faunimonas sp. B44]|uniref:tripartite tricarboxylate transporter TctB family protein n=1 Tax=Faunimonas sp. B44 TaxID=3461493 RepID=UPI004043F4BF
MTDADRIDGSERRGAAPPAFGFDRSDLAVSGVLILICAILYWDTTRWDAVPQALAQNAPPTVFPRLLIGSVFVMALLLPFERIWKARAGIDLGIGGHTIARPVVFITAAMLLLAVYLLPILGVLPVMVATSLLLPILWGERRYVAVALFGIGLPLAVTALFAFALKVNLGFGLTGNLFR